MKKLSLLSLLMSLTISLSAQDEISDYSFIAGASFNYLQGSNGERPVGTLSRTGFSRDTETTFSGFTFAPVLGKIINQQWIIGLTGKYQTGKRESKGEDLFLPSSSTVRDSFLRVVTTGSKQVGIFARYIVNPENRLSVFLQPAILYAITHAKDEELDFKSNSIDLGVGLGMNYNLNERWSAMLNLGGISYTTGNRELKDTVKNKEETKDFNDFVFDVSLATISLGVELKF